MLLILVTLSIVLASVLLHYLCLLGLSLSLPELRIAGPLKILVGVVGAIVAHVAEVGLFAAAYCFMSGRPAWPIRPPASWWAKWARPRWASTS